jgi:hypothetical protein
MSSDAAGAKPLTGNTDEGPGEAARRVEAVPSDGRESPGGERPTSESGGGERPTSESGAGERPTSESGAGERPTSESGAGERPTSESGGGETLAAETGTAETLAAETPAAPAEAPPGPKVVRRVVCGYKLGWLPGEWLQTWRRLDRAFETANLKVEASLAPLEDLPADTDILVVSPDLREAARGAVPPGTPILVTPASAAAGAFAELVSRLQAGTEFTAEKIDPIGARRST